MDRHNLFNFLAKDASHTRGSRDSVDNLGCVRLRRPGTISYRSLLDKGLGLWNRPAA